MICSDCLDGSCKSCRRKVYQWQWGQNNKEKKAASDRAYREKNQTHVKEQRKQYYALNADAGKENAKAWYWNNKERAAETSKAYYEEHKETIKKSIYAWQKANPKKVLIYSRRKWAKNPESTRRSHRKRQGIVDFDKGPQLVALQEGLCAICRKNAATHMDHDHATGRARGMLCITCNSGLGMLKDSKEMLLRAVQYLETPPAQRLQSDLNAYTLPAPADTLCLL